MQTYLIVASNQVFIEEEIEKVKKKLQISSFNFHQITPLPSIGIEEIRGLRQILTLKPYSGGKRLVVIKETEKATLEAQNALLKILEEPPPETYLFLITDSADKLLPTVVSRCQIIREKNKGTSLSANSGKMEELLWRILTSSQGERILLSQKLAPTKEEALIFLTSLLLFFHHLLLKPGKLPLSPSQTVTLIKKVTAAKKYLEQNINYKATLDILLLSFPTRPHTPGVC